MHNERRENSPSATVYVVEQSKLLPWLMVICLLAGVSLGISVWAIFQARIAEREARILKINVDGYETALALQGIDPHKHLPGDE